LFQPSDGETYTVTTSLLTPGPQSVPVSLFYEEEPVSSSIMLAQPSRVLLDTGIQSAPEVQIAVTEESGQAPLTNVAATLTNLVQWGGTNVISVLTNTSLLLPDIGAGESSAATWLVGFSTNLPRGKYTGTATLNSAQTADLSVPVVALVRKASEVVSLLGGTNTGLGELQLELPIPASGNTQTWVHIPKGFFVLHGTLGVAPASTNLQSPTIDIGADDTVDWAFSGLMNVGMALPDIEAPFNEYLKTQPASPTGTLVPIKLNGNSGESLLMAGLQLYLENIPNELRAMEVLPNGTARFQLLGQPGYNYTIQASTNLVDWDGIGLVQVTNTTMPVVDLSAPSNGTRFYRAVLE
jgi:hypothetical protein